MRTCRPSASSATGCSERAPTRSGRRSGPTSARASVRCWSRDSRPGTKACCLFLERSGFPEETYHTFSYSPVYDDGGRIAGMLCVVTEVTESVLAERRQHTLRDLGARASFLERASTAREACRVAVETLAQNPSDLPFVAALVVERGQQSALPVAAVGVELASLGLDGAQDLTRAGGRWPLAAVVRSRQPMVVADLAQPADRCRPLAATGGAGAARAHHGTRL